MSKNFLYFLFIKIFIFIKGTLTNTLTGHTTAVTDVNWCRLPSSRRNILATCADDQTIRIYDGESFELIKVLNTHDIYGWHTLTYMEIDNSRDALYVTTQNGYLVSWDLQTYERTFCRKMHAGSIEGIALSSDKESLLTIGSDCVLTRFDLM